MAASLLERLGGTDGLTAAVTLFYEKVAADPRVSRFFAHLDMDTQIDKQVAFMTYAFGETAAYDGRDLRSAHADSVRKGLGDAEFDAVLELLDSTLTELGVERPTSDEVMAIVSSTRDDVLGRAQG